jgi:hypothetical protein
MKKLSELNFHNFFPSGKKTVDGGGGHDKLHVGEPLHLSIAMEEEKHGVKRLIKRNDEQSGAGVLLCTFESINAKVSSFPARETSVRRVIFSSPCSIFS